jgi:hypothetical protein
MKSTVNILIEHESVFINACLNGHLELAKWSSEIKPTINISYDCLFRFTCFYGHLEVAKWLLEIKPRLIISACDELAFRYACQCGHLEVAKWLLVIKPTINISACSEVAFRYACQSGHLELAKWLFEICQTINISTDNEYAFKIACLRHHLEVVKWFHTLYPEIYNYEVMNDEIICLINKSIKTIQTIVKEEKEECCICQDKLEEINTNCGHTFCHYCINHYYNELDKKTCPYCRQNIKHFIKIM